MQLTNSTSRFGPVAQGLHWLIAALIIVQYFLAELAEEAGAARRTDPSAALDQLMLMARHKSFGITILALAVLRLSWRAVNQPPPWPAAMPSWQVRVARTTHWLFYGLLFAIPITGWLASSAKNYPVSWFGLVQLPDLVAPDKGLAHDLEEVHEIFFNVLVVLAAIHVAAALKHQFIDKDGVLMRMVPWSRD